MQLTVIGSGYVGLVSGTCFAEMGNQVVCVDVDEQKIADLRHGIIPIHEPGLETLIRGNVAEGRLEFMTSLPQAMEHSTLLFIAVGTPPGEDGSADLTYVLNVAREIGDHLTQYSVIVDKSTVPVGTADRVRETIQQQLDQRGVQIDFDVVSNPEFLKEGAAIEDFMKPDRIIIGSHSERATEVMRQLYVPFNRNHDRTLLMGVRDAEMTKYAANAMLATKISFINEVADLCERLGVDVESVRRGIGSDNRIGYSFIYPGCGYGGSCFPKDVQALMRIATDCGVESQILASVERRNQLQKGWFGHHLQQRFGDQLKDMTVAVWGLAFKPGTDDMREAPSKVLLQNLMDAGVKVLAYDPVAMTTARRELPPDWFESGQLQLVNNQYQAVEGADALLLVTEWKPFRHPDFDALRRTMRQPIIFDGRNQYEPEVTRSLGFEYYGVGRIRN